MTIFDKKLGLGETPTPLVGTKSQVCPKFFWTASLKQRREEPDFHPRLLLSAAGNSSDLLIPKRIFKPEHIYPAPTKNTFNTFLLQLTVVLSCHGGVCGSSASTPYTSSPKYKKFRSPNSSTFIYNLRRKQRGRINTIRWDKYDWNLKFVDILAQ